MNREMIHELEQDFLEQHTANTVEPAVYSTAKQISKGTRTVPVASELMLSDDWTYADEDQVGEPVEWVVDHSGFGTPGEPALTYPEFIEKLKDYWTRHPGHGFVISGVGQFQVYVHAVVPMVYDEEEAD